MANLPGKGSLNNMHILRQKSCIAALALLISFTLSAQAERAKWEDYFPESPDPFMGDWAGEWLEGENVDTKLFAQVIPLGKNKYRINLVAKLDLRSPPRAVAEVTANGDRLSFKEGSFFGEINGDRFTGGRGKKAHFELKKITRLSPTLHLPPPDGAIVLFDGSNFDAWSDPTDWRILPDGVMMVTPDAETLESKQKFKDVKLHLEFRTPYIARARGQLNGNSGVYLQSTYEVQILNSYGLEGYYDECGALYKVSPPRVNACAPPVQWQTYDITYRAPRHDAEGNVTENPRMTVYHNGVLVQADQEMAWVTAWTEEERQAPHAHEAMSLQLQGHNNYVQFRNIWLIDLASANN